MRHVWGRASALPAIALVTALTLPVGHAQQATPQRPGGTVSATITAVLVDVVVRDRRGQPVRDLDLSEFQVLEDGVPQTIASFSRVFDGSAAPRATPTIPAAAPESSTAAVGSAPPAAPGPLVTAIVFDRLSPEARRLAVQAAQRYIGSKQETSAYTGIFTIDLALTPFAPFTRDLRALERALERVGKGASASFNRAELVQQKAAADERAGTAAQGASGAQGPPQGAGPDAILAQMQSQMLEDFDVMERDQQGYATTNGLMAIVSTLRQLPGRKSLIFFSEGLALPPAVQRLFVGVIDAANRANVSIYTMDAAGLRTESEQAKIRDQVNRAAGAGTGILSRPTGDRAPLTRGLEQNEDTLRQDPHTGLAELAHDTGGMFFESTNNLSDGFQQIETDLRNYYLIGYTSSNETYDGRFRTIHVKVQRPGVTVASRKGYFAVRDTGGQPINEWTVPALVALEQKPVPNAFPVRAGALVFPERARPGLVPVIVDLKTAPLTFKSADEGKSYTSDFTVLVRFLDEQRQVVRQVSQHYEVKGPIAEIERAKRGEVLFYRQAELPPGVYTMEAVVHDAPSGLSSVRVATVEVPIVDASKLRLSSLVLVKRGEKVAENERQNDNPLFVNDVVLFPNLGEPVSKGSKEVGFYFAIYPGAAKATPEAAIELLQNGVLLARVPMPQNAPDESQRIAQAGRLPLEQLTPGTYELRAVVKQGTEQVSRSTILRVVE
jgi:VWFA-related protein